MFSVGVFVLATTIIYTPKLQQKSIFDITYIEKASISDVPITITASCSIRQPKPTWNISPILYLHIENVNLETIKSIEQIYVNLNHLWEV